MNWRDSKIVKRYESFAKFYFDTDPKLQRILFNNPDVRMTFVFNRSGEFSPMAYDGAVFGVEKY